MRAAQVTSGCMFSAPTKTRDLAPHLTDTINHFQNLGCMSFGLESAGLLASALCNHVVITSVIRLRCVDGNLGFVLLYEFGKTTFQALRSQRQRRDVFNLAMRCHEMQNENLR